MLEQNFRKFSTEPLETLNLIDMGAGSGLKYPVEQIIICVKGSYDELLLKAGIKNITLVDASQKMLEKARYRMDQAGLSNRATILQSGIANIDQPT